MLLFENLISALEQLWANKIRSLLTVLGIIIAVMSTVLVVAVVQGFSTYITSFLMGLGTNALWVFPEQPPGHHMGFRGQAQMTQADLDEVQRTCSEVQRLAPQISRSVTVNFFNREITTEMMGTSPDFQNIRSFYVQKGRFFGPVEIENRKQVCVIGQEALRKLGGDEGIVGQYLTLNRKRFLVVGLLERKGSFLGQSQDDLIIVPHTTALQMFPDAKRFLIFMVQAASPELVPEVKAQMISALRRRHRLNPGEPNDFGIKSQDEILKEWEKISQVGTGVLLAIVGVSLLVGGIGIMNVMLVSVQERTREIGLRKAIGARRRDILFQFLTEAVVLSLVGGLIGVGLGYGLTRFLSLHPSMVDISVPMWAVGLGMSFSMVVGVVFGLLPAFKAAIIQPIDALRHE